MPDPAPAPAKPLTERHRAFVEAYVRLGVAWRAYAETHPRASEATAQTEGPALLRNPRIAEAVAERRADLANAKGLTREWVLDGLERVYRQAVDGAPKVLRDGELARDADGEVIREWHPQGALRALELIGKTHAMWVDRVDHSGEQGVVFRLDLGGGDRIVTDDPDDDDPEVVDTEDDPE